MVQWAPFVHPCLEVLEVQQGLGVPVLQEALGAQPHLQALQRQKSVEGEPEKQFPKDKEGEGSTDRLVGYLTAHAG